MATPCSRTCRVRAAGECGIQDRRPSSGAAGLPGGSGALCENAFHFGQVSAHDRGVNAVAGDLRVLGEEALGRAIVHSMVALAVGVVIPAGELEKRRDTLFVGPPTRLALERGRLRCLAVDTVRQRLPALVAMLAGERVLDVTQHGIGGRGRICPGEPLPRVGIVGAQRLQPALRGLVQIVEGRHETPSFRCAWRPLTSGRKKVRGCESNRWVGGDSLAADRRRPSAHWGQCQATWWNLSTERSRTECHRSRRAPGDRSATIVGTRP